MTEALVALSEGQEDSSHVVVDEVWIQAADHPAMAPAGLVNLVLRRFIRHKVENFVVIVSADSNDFHCGVD